MNREASASEAPATARPGDAATGLLPVATFNGAYLLAATLFALSQGNTEFLLYIAVMLLLIVAVWLVHRSVGLSSSSITAM